jgi:hypothetical protein
MVRSGVDGILAGYVSRNDHDTFRHDPGFAPVAEDSPDENHLAGVDRSSP